MYFDNFMPSCVNTFTVGTVHMNLGFSISYQLHNSPGDWASELFKPSKNACAKYSSYNEKNF